jgi:hypothetical protein
MIYFQAIYITIVYKTILKLQAILYHYFKTIQPTLKPKQMQTLNQQQPIFYKGKKCDFIFWASYNLDFNLKIRVMIGKRIRNVFYSDLTN